MKKIFWIPLLLIPSLAFAQLKQQEEPVHFSNWLTRGLNSPQGVAGLFGFDPDRFSMQQSYSLSYGSLAGRSYSQGVYLNTMGYQLNDEMNVSLQWGVLNQPLGSLGVSPLYDSGFFISNARFEYKPSSNFSMGVEFSKYPGSYDYRPYRWWNSHYRSGQFDSSSPLMQQ